MEQITKDKFPSNGGWKFRQPQFGNWQNPMALVGFDASVKEIIKVRERNKALSLKHNLGTDYLTVANELIEYNRVIRGLPLTDFIPKPNPLWQSSRSAGVAVAADARPTWFKQLGRLGKGVLTLANWLGDDGVPVEATLSEQRAITCADCPKNAKGDLFSFFTKPASELIRRQLEERNALNLSTTQDEQLGICSACGCPLRLKVHVPLSFIRAHMSTEDTTKLDPRCWITKEP